MTDHFLEYPLVDGFIHNWLVAGPQVLEQPADRPLVVPEKPPLERSEFQTPAGAERWQYYRCLEDHLIDLSSVYSPGSFVRAWAYAKLVTQPARIPVQVYAAGSVEVLLNGQLVFKSPAGDKPAASLKPKAYMFQVSLQAENELFVRFATHTSPATRHILAFKLVGLDDKAVTVQVPTINTYPHRHKRFEELFDFAYLDKYVHHKGNEINILWAEEAERTTSYSYRVQDHLKMNYVTGNGDVQDEPNNVGHPQRLWERQLFLTLTAPDREYWDMGARYERRLPLQVLDTAYARQPEETYVQRRKLALEHASRREPDLYAEIAKMVLEQWDKVNTDYILEAVEKVKAAKDPALREVVGLLGMLYRFKDQPDFPVKALKPVEGALLDYAYPGVGSSSESGSLTENQALLSHTAAVLAGQIFPRRSFGKLGIKGKELQQAAGDQIQTRMVQHCQQGFAAWHADTEIEGLVIALSHLVSLAEDQVVRETAAILLDKIIFLLAVNSHQGVYAAAHSCVSAGGVESGQLLAGTALSRLLYGVGVYNRYFAGPVSLACSEYEFPSFFADIAVHPPKELLHKERQVGADGSEANLVTYRTPDTLLSSVQDYHPGEAGSCEQVWQAALGPDAVVYTNHPGAMGESESLQPGFWLGNGCLPRVAQHADSLVAVYNLPEEAWMGFTHAHFPVKAFDETVFARGWAFGRVGDGFIGLTCSNGFEQVRQGVGAFRELRAMGRQGVWLCIVGNKAVYRGFRKFQKKCMAIQPAWQPLGVSFTSPRGEVIEFGWQGPLRVNDQEQPLAGFKHIEDPFCSVELGADHMDIQHGEILMRLNFA